MTKSPKAQQPLAALFKKYKRVVYANNPLEEVILQIRYPTYLRLQKDTPAKFQDAILGLYPHYEAQDVMEVKVTNIGAPPSLEETKTHVFYSADKFWRITLSGASLSIATKKYEHWDDFSDRAKFCFQEFFKEYPIKLLTRVGLRYRDLINRKVIKKDGVPWQKLLNPLLLGPGGAKDFADVTLHAARWSQQFALDDLMVNFQGGTRTHNGEPCYFLDTDVYFPKELLIDTGALDSELDRLHAPVGPLFRWAIQPELHNALGPKP
jgi:uncharacterized protein (TIGR04255 family)